MDLLKFPHMGLRVGGGGAKTYRILNFVVGLIQTKLRIPNGRQCSERYGSNSAEDKDARLWCLLHVV